MKAALLIVDVQRYYLDPASNFCAYSEQRWPGSTGYLHDRSTKIVFPAILRLRKAFDAEGWPVVYLRLCGTRKDRSDLHRFFRSFWANAEAAGFLAVYPLASDPWAEVVEGIKPRQHDHIVDKTGFSGFSNPGLEGLLRKMDIELLVMTGLATSQCVDTTARDGSDKGFSIVHVHDAQADYNEDVHQAALYASCGVCGSTISSAAIVTANLVEYVKGIRKEELQLPEAVSAEKAD
jgi:nicotinamidase-related amidase